MTKTFLKWYALAVLAIATVPALFAAVVAMAGASFGDMSDAMLLVGTAAFGATFIFMVLVEMYPAIIVLLVGVVLCLILSSSKSSAR